MVIARVIHSARSGNVTIDGCAGVWWTGGRGWHPGEVEEVEARAVAADRHRLPC